MRRLAFVKKKEQIADLRGQRVLATWEIMGASPEDEETMREINGISKNEEAFRWLFCHSPSVSPRLGKQAQFRVICADTRPVVGVDPLQSPWTLPNVVKTTPPVFLPLRSNRLRPRSSSAPFQIVQAPLNHSYRNHATPLAADARYLADPKVGISPNEEASSKARTILQQVGAS
jgi:hypothetical protein